MKNYFKNLVALFSLLVLSASCVDESFKDPEFGNCVSPGLVKNKEVTQVYTASTAATQNYTADDIVEAYVISSDEGGNFYKSMYFQPTDGSRGFNLSMDEISMYLKTGFQTGNKVFLKMKGLAYANPSSFARGLIFGAPPTDIFAVDRIAAGDYTKYLVPSCNAVSEDAIVKNLTLTQAASDTYINTLVEFDNVQFAEESVGGTYDPNREDTFDASINITNGTQNFVVRTSRYATFAGSEVTGLRGKIRGVMTKYNGTYQIILRTLRDVKMTLPRLDFSPAIGGTNITFPVTLNETFESYPITSSGMAFPNYVNDAFVGSRYWDVKSFSNNKYIQMTAFNSGGTNRTFLFMPITFTPGYKFNFKSKDGFNNGPVLRVYYIKAADYTPGTAVNTANLVDITSSFNIATGTASGYATNFTNSNNFVIPSSLTGTGFFVFEYLGNPTDSTTIQLDDVKVTP